MLEFVIKDDGGVEIHGSVWELRELATCCTFAAMMGEAHLNFTPDDLPKTQINVYRLEDADGS